jgi:hypothetical protein
MSDMMTNKINISSNGKQYVIAGSLDGENWFQLASVTNGDKITPTDLLLPPTRLRYVRIIIKSTWEVAGGSAANKSAKVTDCKLYVSEPFRRVRNHAIYRLDYLDPAFGNVALRPSETDRIATFDPANANAVTLTQILRQSFPYNHSFRSEEVSRSGNVATHQFVDLNGLPYDPNIILDPGYYYIADDYNDIEGAWAFRLDQDFGTFRLSGDDNLWMQSEYTGDPLQFAASGLKLVAHDFNGSQLDPDYVPNFVFTNYKFVGATYRTAMISTTTADRDGDLLTGVMGVGNNTVLTAGMSVAAPSPFKLSGPDAVLLNSTRIAQGNAVGGGGGDGSKLDQNVIDMISMRHTPRGQYAWYQPADTVGSLIRYPFNNDISTIDFEITDTHGRPLTLPPNYHVTVVMRLISQLLDGV